MIAGLKPIERVNWIGFWTLYRKEVWRFLKVPLQTVVTPAVTALLMITIFSLALGGAVRRVAGVPFIEFLAPGLVMMAIIQNSFANSSSSLLISKIQGNIVDVLMPPLTPGELALGFVLGGVTRGLIVGLCLFAVVGPLTGVVPRHWEFVLFHAVFASLALSMLGLMGGIWAEKFDHMATVTNFVITPMAFLSGTFYSIERLPPLWRTVSQFNPLFYMIDGFRYGFTGRADGALDVGVVVVVVVTLGFWVVCHVLLASGYRLKP